MGRQGNQASGVDELGSTVSMRAADLSSQAERLSTAELVSAAELTNMAKTPGTGEPEDDPGAGRREGTDLNQEEADLDRRLSRIEGQVRGIRRMVAEGRDCRELSMQFAAVAKALDRAAINYLTAHLVYCIENPDAALQEGYSLEELRRLLGRLH